jgi:hypothetical protein
VIFNQSVFSRRRLVHIFIRGEVYVHTTSLTPPTLYLSSLGQAQQVLYVLYVCARGIMVTLSLRFFIYFLGNVLALLYFRCFPTRSIIILAVYHQDKSDELFFNLIKRC